MVMAYAISGRLDFNPLTDSIENELGKMVKLDIPEGVVYPPLGFDVEDPGYQAPAVDGSNIEIVVADDSKRLQLLSPFKAWDDNNYEGLKLLHKS